MLLLVEGKELTTKLESQLWTELNITKTQLVKANEKLELYASEKARFIETMRRNVSPLKRFYHRLNYILISRNIDF